MKHKLVRTGDAPLVFEGELIAESNGRVVSGKEQNRWHDLRIYRTNGGNYVLEIAYVTKWEGEVGFRFAYQVDRESVVSDLKNYDPVSVVQGFPRSPAYTERQANLECWIRQRYEDQVGQILSEIEELFEKID